MKGPLTPGIVERMRLTQQLGRRVATRYKMLGFMRRELPRTKIHEAHKIAINLMAYSRLAPVTDEEKSCFLFQPSPHELKIQHIRGRTYLAWGVKDINGETEHTHMLALGRAQTKHLTESVLAIGAMTGEVALGTHAKPAQKKAFFTMQGRDVYDMGNSIHCFFFRLASFE